MMWCNFATERTGSPVSTQAIAVWGLGLSDLGKLCWCVIVGGKAGDLAGEPPICLLAAFGDHVAYWTWRVAVFTAQCFTEARSARLVRPRVVLAPFFFGAGRWYERDAAAG